MQCHPERVEGSHKREEVHIKRKMFRRRCALLNMTNAFPQKECRTVILSVKQSGTDEGPQTMHCHPERTGVQSKDLDLKKELKNISNLKCTKQKEHTIIMYTS